MYNQSESDLNIEMSKILTTKRLVEQNYKLTIDAKKDSDSEANRIRSDFNIDYDRLIFSQSFRKLGGKTQVHPLADNDIVHTRLTHSLETASVGRSLGMIVGDFLLYKENISRDELSVHDIATIVQTACLLHDLGNPPFGHAGEDAIKNWFMDFVENNSYLNDNLDEGCLEELKYFDGNAQGLRISTKLENNFNKGGMNLTITTLASMIKYPNFAYESNKKFSVFLTEKEIFDMIFTELGLFVTGEQGKKYLRHPLSFLMEAADDICYALIDIVDAIELNIVEINEAIPLYERILGKVKIEEIISNSILNDTRKVSKLTALSMNELTLCAGNLFNKNIDRFLNKNEVRKIKSLIELDTELSDSITTFKNFARKHIFSENNKRKLEIAANKILGDLLEHFVNAVIDLDKNEEDKISHKSRHILEIMGIYRPTKSSSLYEKIRAVIDFISGMTDRYAVSLFQQLNGMSFQFKRI